MPLTSGEPWGLCPLGKCLQTDSLSFGSDPHFQKGTDTHVQSIGSAKQLHLRELMCPPPGELFLSGCSGFLCIMRNPGKARVWR